MKVTVNNQEKKEVIDWGKVQLVQSENGVIVLTSGEYCDKLYFSGICLSVGGSCNRKGSISNRWFMPMFKPFHGSITLQND